MNGFCNTSCRHLPSMPRVSPSLQEIHVTASHVGCAWPPVTDVNSIHNQSINQSIHKTYLFIYSFSFLFFFKPPYSTDLAAILGETGSLLVTSQLAADPSIPGPTQLTTPPPVSPDLLSALESEILSVFPLSSNSLITPDSVRTALQLPPDANIFQHLLQPPSSSACPWPDFETLRGKILFGLIFPQSDAVDTYTQLHLNQQGAVGWLVWDSFFVADAVLTTVGGGLSMSEQGNMVPPSIPADAAKIVDDAVATVNERVGQGYLVRTRTDADTIEAHANNGTGYRGRADALLNTGAQVIATDYPIFTTSGPQNPFLSGVNYSVVLEGGQMTRCVNGAQGSAYLGAEVVCNPAALNLNANSPTAEEGGGAGVVVAVAAAPPPSNSPIGKEKNGSPGVEEQSAVVAAAGVPGSPPPPPPRSSSSSSGICGRTELMVYGVAHSLALFFLFI